MVGQTAITAENLVKKFDWLTAVDGISLQLEEGEVFGLLGPNGAGKTTTVRVICGILPPTSGKITVLGKDVATDAVEVKGSIGLLPETPSVYESLTAQENLEFFSEMYGVPKDERARTIDELLDTFGLSERRSSKVETFSKGMKQKLALARTLVHDPPIVFLDEPTSGLDPESAKMVRGKISEMSSRADKTVFICTHNLAEAESLCGRVGIIKSGKILRIGSPRDLQEDSGLATYSLHLEQVPPGLPEVLRGLECVDAVQQRTEHVLEVSLSSDDLAPDLVAAALGAGARVREFRRETKSLEDVYLEAVRD